MRTAFLLLAFATSLSANCVAQSPEDVLRAWTAAATAGDSARLVALYADDPAVVTVGDGRASRGTAAVRREIGRWLAKRRGEFTARDVTGTRLGGAMLVTAGWSLRTPPPDPRTVDGVVTMVLVPRDGRWRIVQDHWSTTPEAPVAAPVTAALPDSGPAMPAAASLECTLAKVVDGDTIECAEQGRVRLIGIDTPERSQPPFGAEATAVLRQLLGRARRLRLEPDVEQRDKYGRLLAYVWADGRMANWLMARSGYAVQLTYPPNVRYVERFTEAVRAAREEGRGLWPTGGFACDPKEHRKRRC